MQIFLQHWHHWSGHLSGYKGQFLCVGVRARAVYHLIKNTARRGLIMSRWAKITQGAEFYVAM